MVYCVCCNCESDDLKLSDNEKYLICNKCGESQYIRDLEIGFCEYNIKEEN